MRMKSYQGTMLKQVRYLDYKRNERINRQVLAPVEHLFNNHEYCGEQWCQILQAQKEGKPYVPEESRPLFNKTDDKKMQDQLKQAVA